MLELFDGMREELIVLSVAAMPISELRGAIPLGVSMGMDPLYSTLISIIGNILPIPFLLKLLKPIMAYLEKTRLFSKTVGWVKRRALKKSKDKIKKYSILGLFILVAIPLPSTGAWTGCVAATLLKIDFKKALVAIVSGVVMAGIIVFTLTYSIVAAF